MILFTGGGVHGGGRCMSGWACMSGRHVWGCVWQGGVHGRVGGQGCAWQEAGETATAADGTHPTGMHSCLYQSLGVIFFQCPIQSDSYFLRK